MRNKTFGYFALVLFCVCCFFFFAYADLLTAKEQCVGNQTICTHDFKQINFNVYEILTPINPLKSIEFVFASTFSSSCQKKLNQ